jgi:5-methylcytosine-specific restriction endonuclease McrBC regulatory subunit McrC
MCKTNVETNFYYANICKHEHENNMTRLWCKIVLKTSVEYIERNEGSYSYLYPLVI